MQSITYVIIHNTSHKTTLLENKSLRTIKEAMRNVGYDK